MKETVTVNIGSMAFTLDKDACQLLKEYLDDIRRRLPGEDAETMADIEARVAEIFRERVASPMRVISVEVVRATMAQLGAPSDFGEPRTDSAPETPENGRKPRNRLRENSAGRGPTARSPASAADWPHSSTPTPRRSACWRCC